jgi:hypothetical protein
MFLGLAAFLLGIFAELLFGRWWQMRLLIQGLFSEIRDTCAMSQSFIRCTGAGQLLYFTALGGTPTHPHTHTPTHQHIPTHSHNHTTTLTPTHTHIHTLTYPQGVRSCFVSVIVCLSLCPSFLSSLSLHTHSPLPYSASQRFRRDVCSHPPRPQSLVKAGHVSAREADRWQEGLSRSGGEGVAD